MARAHRKQPCTPLSEDFLQRRVPLWAGRYEAHEGGPHGTFVHPYAVIVLITKGLSRVRHGRELELRAGDLHLIPPGDPHGATALQGGEGWALAFYPEVLPPGPAWGREGAPPFGLGPFLRVRGGCHPILTPSAPQRRRIEQLLRYLHEESLRPQQRVSMEAIQALLRLVLIEVERVSAPASLPEPPTLGLARRALTYIEGHCLEALSLTDVAAALGRSSGHVASVMRQETGRTVGAWILEYRMAEARRRLRGTDERVDIIAERVGYADVTHFIRLFRRLHGVTPATWRRKESAGRSARPETLE